MSDGLALFLRIAAALLVGLAALKALLDHRPRPHPRVDAPARPTGGGLRALERLLAAAEESPYARERLQERLGALRQDLDELGGVEADTDLDAYLAEDHTGLRGERPAGGPRRPGFLNLTATMLQRLARRRTHGDATP